MRVDSKFFLVLVPALFALGPFACGSDEDGDGEGTGGAGAAPTSSSTGISTVVSSSTGLAQSSTGTPGNCAGLGANYPGATSGCGACLESQCCSELEESIDELTQELFDCSQTECGPECYAEGETPAEVGTAECAAAAEPAAEGACVPAGLVAQCNPVTNEPCNTAGGEACDQAQGGFFTCFAPPNDTPACDECSNSNGPFCLPGHTCVGTAGTTCAKYCCEDSDCAPGTCFKGDGSPVFPQLPDMGVCAGEGATGGAGGAGGGAGGTGGAGGGAGGTGGA
jgi:hypothetical protein